MQESAEKPIAWLIVGCGVLLVFAGPAPAGALTLGDLALAAATTAAGLLFIALGAAALRGASPMTALDLGPSRPPLRRGEGLALALGLMGASALVDHALEATGWRAGSRLEEIEAALAPASGLGLAGAVVTLALLPAIGEEIFFRGFLLRWLRTRMPALPAVVVSAALFGLAHFDLAQSVGAGILGLYLGLITVATGSVRPAIGAHAANNALAVLAPAAGPALDHPTVGLALLAAFAVGMVASVAILRRRLAPGPSTESA